MLRQCCIGYHHFFVFFVGSIPLHLELLNTINAFCEICEKLYWWRAWITGNAKIRKMSGKKGQIAGYEFTSNWVSFDASGSKVELATETGVVVAGTSAVVVPEVEHFWAQCCSCTSQSHDFSGFSIFDISICRASTSESAEDMEIAVEVVVIAVIVVVNGWWVISPRCLL